MAETLLDNEFLARLEYLVIAMRELFIGHISSTRLARRFGRGVEFADYRSYAPGDDFRHIDWSTFAKRGDMVIKLFSEEESNHVYFILDASRSMATGEPEKLLFAKKLVAAMGYIGLVNADPVTVVAFDEKLRDRSPLFQGRGKLRSLLAFLDGTRADGRSTSLSETVREFFQRRPPRGLLVLVSDFLSREDYEETLRLVRHNRFDILVVRVNHREEIAPTLGQDIELVDAESGQSVTVEVTPDLLASYVARVTRHYGELEQLCRTLRCGHVPVVTDTPLEDVVFDVFRRGGFLQ